MFVTNGVTNSSFWDEWYNKWHEKKEPLRTPFFHDSVVISSDAIFFCGPS